MNRAPQLIRVAMLGLLVATGACVAVDDNEPEQALGGGPARGVGRTPGMAIAPGSLRETPGAYVVPLDVNASALELAAARFDVAMVSQRITTNAGWSQLDINFTLPAGLVGADRPIALTGTIVDGIDEVVVGGPDAAGSCTLRPTLDCSITYYTAAVDLPAVEAYWRARGAGPRTLAARLVVARLFDADPLGVLETAPRGRF